ncbi:DUF6415 family natural product biosynthesis protein [Streptomyces macrosporus]|uniref:Uncharacterized protein n=1 Tax=Streptomyces macrosporus TaxID=44032 RepID=A0ABN3KMP7_9ACTN
MGGDRVDVAAIRQAVDRALAVGPVLPRHQEVEDLIADLRGHLQILLSTVRVTECARATTALAELERGPGRGLRSAADHAQLLALDCRWALRYLTAQEGTR